MVARPKLAERKEAVREALSKIPVVSRDADPETKVYITNRNIR